MHTRNGASFTGILSSFDLQPELALVLSHVLPHPLPDPVPSPEKCYIFHPKEISSISASQVSFAVQPAAPGSGFKTDTAISNTAHSGERQLERWRPDTNSQPLQSLSGTLDIDSGGQWDQFAAHERMFGGKSSYNEEFYTTKLDRSHPEFEKRYQAAETIAREIESKTSSNLHIQEERGQRVDDSGIDEEDKYAGVVRTPAPAPAPAAPTLAYAAAAAGTKYTPPAKRTEMAKLVDPAIISSKLRTEPVRTEPEKPAEEVENPVEKPVESEKSEKPKPVLPLATNGSAVPVVKEPDDQTPQIQEAGQKFVKEEKSKIKRARNLIGTKEKQRQFQEFAEFSSSLTLNMPVPSDLLPILAGKDANRQRALMERNAELKKKADEKSKVDKDKAVQQAHQTQQTQQTQQAQSLSATPATASSPSVISPVASPGPSLTERIKANQTRVPGTIPSPIASPTPLDPGTVKSLSSTTTSKKLDPSAKEFVFKVNAKEFKPSYSTPSTHSPSPSRSSVVSPPPTRLQLQRSEDKPLPGFWEKKSRRQTPPTMFNTLNNFYTLKADFKPEQDGSKFQIPMAYSTHPAWPPSDGDDTNSKGYLDVFTEGKSLPPTPTSGPDDHSPGHTYSRSSSSHPHHSSPHPPQLLPAQPQVVPYTPAHPMYPPMGVVGQFGYPLPQQLPIHPQQGVQPGFPSQLLPNQFPQHQQGGPYRTFQQQGYQSVSPSPLMQHASPAQYAPQPSYPNGQFPYPQAPLYPAGPPYGYIPQQQQQNGGFSGHPSPGRAAQAMVYQGMPPMNMFPQQQMYQGIVSEVG